MLGFQPSNIIMARALSVAQGYHRMGRWHGNPNLEKCAKSFSPGIRNCDHCL